MDQEKSLPLLLYQLPMNEQRTSFSRTARAFYLFCPFWFFGGELFVCFFLVLDFCFCIFRRAKLRVKSLSPIWYKSVGALQASAELH